MGRGAWWATVHGAAEESDMTATKQQQLLDSMPYICAIYKDQQDSFPTHGQFIIAGGPVVRTLCFHCRGHGSNLWLGN